MSVRVNPIAIDRAALKLYDAYVTCDEMVRLLKAHGWQVKRITGHIQMAHADVPHIVSVPNHGRKELRKGTEQAILKDAGLK